METLTDRSERLEGSERDGILYTKVFPNHSKTFLGNRPFRKSRFDIHADQDDTQVVLARKVAS